MQRHLQARGLVPPKTLKKAELMEILQRLVEAEQDSGTQSATEAAGEASAAVEQLRPAPGGDDAADAVGTLAEDPSSTDGLPTLKQLMQKSRAMLQEVHEPLNPVSAL